MTSKYRRVACGIRRRFPSTSTLTDKSGAQPVEHAFAHLVLGHAARTL